MAIDWTALFENMVNGIGTVITALGTTLGTYAPVILGILVGGALLYASTRFAKTVGKSVQKIIGSLMPSF